MSRTSIEWTRGDDGSPGRTWNPVRGCSRVSPGCVNCYAESFAARFGAVPGHPFEGYARMVGGDARWTGKVSLIPEKLAEPLSWRKPCRAFVNSMSDLFHEALDAAAIAEVFGVMAVCGATSAMDGAMGGQFGGKYKTGHGWLNWKGPHTFQVLTKRPKRMLELLSSRQFREEIARAAYRRAMDQRDAGYLHDCISARDQYHAPGRAGRMWPLSNVWLGVSVEDQATADERIPLLLQTPAAKRFVSYEPALGPVNFSVALEGTDYKYMHPQRPVDWVIVGGESGPGARPFDIDWARYTVAQCRAAGVAVFVKQLGANPLVGEGCADPGRCCVHDHTGIQRHLKDRKGGNPPEWPEDLRVREFPA
jgi:protein gp37